MKNVTILALKNAVATSVAGPFDVFSQTGGHVEFRQRHAA